MTTNPTVDGNIIATPSDFLGNGIPEDAAPLHP